MMLSQQLKANAAKIVIVALLSLPAIRAVTNKDQTTTENRQLAAVPALPASLDGALKYPAQLDAWINDHFGFRERLLRINNRIRYALFRQFPTSQVTAGRDGRIFLSGHEAYYPPYHTIKLTCGLQYVEREKIMGELNAFRTVSEQLGIDAKLLIAPSAPVVHREQLPEWLAHRCAMTVPPIKEMITSQALDPAVKASVYYPLEEMREMKEQDAFPKTWFHWAGAGSRVAAESSMSHFWKIDRQAGTLPRTKIDAMRSDISHLFPGVSLKSNIENIDFVASGVEVCDGGKCYPAMEEVMEKLGDVSRYSNPGAPYPRVVLVTDSFGRYIAGWYSRYYRDVMHVSTNAIGRLSDPELQQLREFLRVQAGGGNLIFVYHDAGVLAGRIGMDLKKLVAAAPVGSRGMGTGRH